jgi:hypothetical protein
MREKGRRRALSSCVVEEQEDFCLLFAPKYRKGIAAQKE